MEAATSSSASSPSHTISTGAVGLIRAYTGRGPTKARTVISEDSVTVLLGDALTRGERKLVEAGLSNRVLQIRHDFQEAMRGDLVELVETALDRKVVAFMSNNHIDPDVAAEVFVLDPVPRSP